MKFSDIYIQLLSTLQSDMLSKMTDEQIVEYLDKLMIRAIADFSFPYNSLDYENNGTEYVFTNGISQREVNVLIKMIKSFWLEKQLDNDDLFGVFYYDKDVKTYSTANKIKALQSRYESSRIEVKEALSNYYSAKDGEAFIGSIYE